MGMIDSIKTWASYIGIIKPSYNHLERNPGSWKDINTNQTSNSTSYLITTLIDRIAKDISMVEVKHLKSKKPNKESEFTYCLNTQANRLQSASDFIYQIVFELYTKYDVFIQYDAIEKEFEVLDIHSLSFGYDEKKVYLFAKNKLGISRTYDYSKLIHLRFRPAHIDFSAKSDDVSSLIDIVTKSTKKQLDELKDTKDIKGLLKVPAALNKEDRKRKVEEFKEAIVDDIGTLDNTVEFQELNNDYTSDFKGMDIAKKEIYTVFGSSEEILNGTYTETQYNAYKRNTLEPLAKKLSQSFSAKLLPNNKEESLVFDINSVKLANLSQQAQYINVMLATGVATLNEARDYIDLPPVENGDVNRVSLNNVNSNVATEYQLVNASKDMNINDLKGGEDKDENNDI